MSNPVDFRRRKLLIGLAALPVSGLARASMATPPATEGPFYPRGDMRYDDIDNDLVSIGDSLIKAGGEIVRLAGRVVDSAGKPVVGARVEIWQCDVKGRYLHRGDSGWNSRDQAFQGFGHDIAGADGGYSFRTIKPVPYTGRTPHIHVKVLHQGRDLLTTQFYLPDHPDNANDWLYQRVPADRRGLVTMDFRPSGDAEPLATLDLVV